LKSVTIADLPLDLLPQTKVISNVAFDLVGKASARFGWFGPVVEFGTRLSKGSNTFGAPGPANNDESTLNLFGREIKIQLFLFDLVPIASERTFGFRASAIKSALLKVSTAAQTVA
jgi:hypothetical protein